NVKNSQVAVICAAILAGALINAVGNFVLVRSLREDSSRRVGTAAGPGQGPAAAQPVGEPVVPPRPERAPMTLAIMPKSKATAYFIACRKGAEEAARELGVQLIWDGPTDPDPAKQNEIIDTWITRGVDVIAVAVENRQGVSSVLRKARERGIKVLTWDA